MYKYCIRIKQNGAPELIDKRRSELVSLLQKIGCLIHPEGFPVTVWAASKDKLVDLTRGVTSDLVEDMVESDIPDWWTKEDLLKEKALKKLLTQPSNADANN